MDRDRELTESKPAPKKTYLGPAPLSPIYGLNDAELRAWLDRTDFKKVMPDASDA